VTILYDGNGRVDSVDGGGFLWRRCTGDDVDDPETKGVAGMGSGLKMFEEFFNRTGHKIYIPMCCLWHRVEQISGTEM
jgi:hypothetical protein